jgi:Aspartyl/Asparaginyl beta-hydroxylase
MTEVTETAKDMSRFMQTYAKSYSAGAFAVPTASELTPENCSGFNFRGSGPNNTGGGRVVFAHHRLTRDSKRKDFTGRTYNIPAGANVITHFARTRGAPLPDISGFDAIFAYREDRELSGQLIGAGRHPLFHRITAASEIITCWGRGEYPALPLAHHDRATALPLPGGRVWERPNVLLEARQVSQWDDDFPYYSDGSWSAVSLRGFYDDPRKGVKPSEMPKTWKAAHLEDLALECHWTALGERMPATRALVDSLCSAYGWKGLERVRLLKMAGRASLSGTAIAAKLSRHTDIGDKAAGLQDGQIARFHIPLVTHPEVKMTIWDLDGRKTDYHLPTFSCWYLDARKPHAVTNPSGQDRVHLVVDVVADQGLRTLLGSTYAHSQAVNFSGRGA